MVSGVLRRLAEGETLNENQNKCEGGRPPGERQLEFDEDPLEVLIARTEVAHAKEEEMKTIGVTT